MFLFISTAEARKMFLALFDSRGHILIRKNIQSKNKQSEKLLSGIDKILALESKRFGNMKNKCRLIGKIDGLAVVKGPGSFTALRIGIATANAIAFALGIPVVGILNGEQEEMIQCAKKKVKKCKKGEYAIPEYGMEPNIGKQKKRPKRLFVVSKRNKLF